jgi:hypothetical protein
MEGAGVAYTAAAVQQASASRSSGRGTQPCACLMDFCQNQIQMYTLVHAYYRAYKKGKYIWRYICVVMYMQAKKLAGFFM